MEKNKYIAYGILIFIAGLVIGVLYGNSYGLPFHDQGQKSKAFMEMEYDSDSDAVGGSGVGSGVGAGPETPPKGKPSGGTKGGGGATAGPSGGTQPVGPKSN